MAQPVEDDISDDEDSSDEDEKFSNDGQREVAEWFYPYSIGKLLVFGVIGGVWFCAYWAYKNWQAYRTAWGYSREDFWLKVHDATGYRISPFWRAVMVSGYCFCLFPAVERECRATRVRGIRTPVALAILFSVLPVLSLVNASWLVQAFASPVWAVIPVQLAINRLNPESRRPLRITFAEVGFVLFGGLLTWT